MKKIFIITVLVFAAVILCLYILFISITNNNRMNIHATKIILPFNQAIDTIDKKVIDLSAPSDLLGIKDFLGILAYSDDFLNDAQKYLSDTSKSEQKKMIVIFSMQNLNYNNYILFLQTCCDLYEKNIISETITWSVVLPGNDWNTKLINNFYKLKERRILKNIRNNKKSSDELKSVIDDILCGKLWWKEVAKK